MFAFSLLVLSALLHELGHITAMLCLGYKPRRTDILPMGALIVCPQGVPYQSQLIISLAGPIASFAGAVVSGAVYFICHCQGLLFFCVINAVLFLFNMLPAEKNDGGKVLQSLLNLKIKNEKKARRICLAVSIISKLLFAAVVIVCLGFSGCNFGMALLFFALIVQL